MLDRLELENFTVFREVNLDFSPGLNVFVGPNATGKTHILKLLYAVRPPV
jgi:recombinational DNA repair ATPase RecF